MWNANVRVNNNYIYESFEGSAVNKYKISSRTSAYDVTLDLNIKVLKVNKKDHKTGIPGSYTKNCNLKLRVDYDPKGCIV